MPYIGRSTDGFGVRNRFLYLASADDTSVSGADANGATLTFTDGAYVDVYLNGVLLKAGTDYNTNTANTIAGISSMSANDEVTVIVYDIFAVADTVSQSSGGTFSGAITFDSTVSGLDVNGTEIILDADGDTTITADTDDQIDIKVAGSDLAHITSTYAKLRGATPLVFGENNSTGTFQSISGEVGANNLLLRSYQSLTFKNGTSGSSLTDGTTAFNIDANGHVTMPKQSAFNASNISVTQSNIAINTDVTVVFGTERFDNNGDFSSNTFTAPVDGRYQLNTMIRFSAIDTSATYYALFIETSNRSYLNILDPNGFSQDLDYYTLSLSVLADMDASDTAKIVIHQSAGTAQTDLSGGTGSCHFSGHLVA